MAYINSGELKVGSTFTLGNYEFSLSVDATTIGAIGRNTVTGEGAAKAISARDPDVKGWYVEANETEVSIYAALLRRDETVKTVTLDNVQSMSYTYGPALGAYWPDIAVWADFPAVVYFDQTAMNAQTTSPITLVYYPEKDIYQGSIDISGSSQTPDYGPITLDYKELLPQGHASVIKDILVARFAINLGDAGGYPSGGGSGGGVYPGGGGGSIGGWDEPGDYDPEWSPGEPTRTLHLDVRGALSGRHNDPLNDTSYSYVPSNKDTVKSYGCGGDGGHGGGGGAGASTVVVHRFATNRASGKEVMAHSRRHGYGSGGGKGGKGGDGMILIYY